MAFGDYERVLQESFVTKAGSHNYEWVQ